MEGAAKSNGLGGCGGGGFGLERVPFQIFRDSQLLTPDGAGEVNRSRPKNNP
jgi:hypothetical protein